MNFKALIPELLPPPPRKKRKLNATSEDRSQKVSSKLI
jgi:hypothetical protein